VFARRPASARRQAVWIYCTRTGLIVSPTRKGGMTPLHTSLARRANTIALIASACSTNHFRNVTRVIGGFLRFSLESLLDERIRRRCISLASVFSTRRAVDASAPSPVPRGFLNPSATLWPLQRNKPRHHEDAGAWFVNGMPEAGRTRLAKFLADFGSLWLTPLPVSAFASRILPCPRCREPAA
jgi:hypothetical protein